MNCQEALSLLYTIIDKEASEVDAQQVKDHLHKCKHCFEVYQLESHIQEFICAKLSSDQEKPQARLETLKAKIVIQLDTIDSESKPVKKNRPPFGTITFTLAAAAFLVVSIGAAIILAGLYRHNDIYIPIEQAHWDAGKQVAKLAAASPATNAAMTHSREDLGYDVASAVEGYELVGGEMEKIMDVDMAHFVYASGNKLVSVFVAPADEFSIPEDLKEQGVARHNLTLYDHHCRGCRLVYHRAGEVIVITASTDHQIDLIDFVPGQARAVEHTI